MDPAAATGQVRVAVIGDGRAADLALPTTLAIRELIPDFVEQGFPTEYVCDKDYFYAFTRGMTIKSPITPPMFQKKGYHVASLSPA